MTSRRSSVQWSRMNWAIGHGSSGGRCARRSGEVADQHADQFALAVPEAGQQLPFFFGRQQVGRKRGDVGFGYLGRLAGSLTPCSLFMAAFAFPGD